MERELKQTLIIVGVVAILVLGGFIGIKAYSGMDGSLTVVVSGSMEHSDKSTVGIIDTGDIIVMKNKDKGITTYVEGYKNGYSQFGEYGDVIIYEREGKNPVIHRTIVWLDYNSDGTYSAPSLNKNDYGTIDQTTGIMEKGKLWWTDTGNNTKFTVLGLNLPDGGSDKTKVFFFESEKGGKISGYLTKGDSVHNEDFDCMCGISNGLVSKEKVKAVAGFEIPWLGVIKLYFGGDTKYIQGNTPFCFIFVILDIIALLAIISLIWDLIDRKYNKQ